MKIVVMGVTGCGKTTVGSALAETLDLPFFDADDFHPPHNVKKMKRGEPLTDKDRRDWLVKLSQLIEQHLHIVLACSALKAAYRRTLSADADVRFVYLEISPDVASTRLALRTNHYMPATLVHSQFAALEPPSDAIRIDAEQDIDAVLRGVIHHIRSCHG